MEQNTVSITVRRGCRVLSLMLILLVLATSFVLPAMAASWGREGTESFLVQTKANYWIPGSSSVTLRQDPTVVTYQAILGNKTKTKKVYGDYVITATPLGGGKTVKVKWNNSKTCKVKLKKIRHTRSR